MVELASSTGRIKFSPKKLRGMIQSEVINGKIDGKYPLEVIVEVRVPDELIKAEV